MPFADALELRSHLANVLQPYLGEWVDGSPRIHVKPPIPKLKARTSLEATTQSEVECIINRHAGGRPQHLSGGQRYQESVYLVRFTNFLDDTKLVNLANVFNRDSQILLARGSVYLDPTDDTYEQLTAYVRVNEVFNSVVYTP